MSRVVETWVSPELMECLGRLTAQQSAGVLRIVQAELEGRGVTSLLDRDGQICTSTTYYNRKRGWAHKAEFQQALALARRDYRSWMLEWGGRDALAILAQTAPDGARALRQQVVGDGEALAALVGLLDSEDARMRLEAATALGETGLRSVAPALAARLVVEPDADVMVAITRALGQIAGSRDSDRRAAVGAVLSRMGLEEAQRLRVEEAEVDAAIEAELARLVAEAGGSG